MTANETTLILPAEQAAFLHEHARRHGMTAADLPGGCVGRLKRAEEEPLHPDILALTGLATADAEGRSAHRRHLLDKHA
ncbi:MAG TPA: hypothetical protein PKE47_09985 [Verrucomicrobiota bacterium]|nr:hypothetical protein [Verrucomicrobiota bacterium]